MGATFMMGASLNTEAALRAETAELWGEAQADAIWGGEDAKTRHQRYQHCMLSNGQAALCLSGGGIRSAAFALGVVQALSQKGLLSQFQYLSTVSGGGYIGGFLSRWIAEESEKLVVQAKEKLKIESLTAAQRSLAERQALGRVQNALAGGAAAPEIEPAPIRWLRENSNFLTPRIGIASADTWTAIAMSVRNILINWLVFAPALLLAVAVPYLGAALLAASTGWFADLCLVLGGVLIALAAWAGARMLPSHVGLESRWGEARIFQLIALPGALGAAALSAGIAPHLNNLKISEKPREVGFISSDWFLSQSNVTRGTILAFACLFIPLLLGYLVAWLQSAHQNKIILARSNQTLFALNLPVWIAGAGISAAFYVWGISLVLEVDCTFRGVDQVEECAWRRDVIATSAVVWGILSQLALTVFFAGFRIIPRGAELSPDLDREWLARVSAEKIRLAFAWTLFAAGALLLQHVLSGAISYITERPQGPVAWLTGVMGVLSGAVAVFGGKRATTGVRPDPDSEKKFLSFDVVVVIATFVFLLILLFVLGKIEFSMAWRISLYLSGYQSLLDQFGKPWLLVLSHLVMMGAIGSVLWITSKKVQVNRFSLNGLYRNRLAKAFLGAAREKRVDADPFTGFAPSDNIRLHKLRAVNPATGRRVLMPVINVALNLVGGNRLAWQERKAQAFVFTPIACGSAELAENPATGKGEGRYICSHVYAGNEPDLGLRGKGVSLATAIAISGAAASPSMGYHSSPATAFLMTLFNVRLGAWLPNPGGKNLSPKVLESSGPRNALAPLLSELLGLTDAEGSSIYLSDGGHFENLGLYEMVRRRCRYIVVSDAGSDPKAQFEDLGNAIRKVRIDLGVSIDIQTATILSCGTWDGKSTFFALGKIRYPSIDGQVETAGDLLYIKPSCVGEIPTDVRAYSRKSTLFPHESTGDQWFSESQFESYRILGEYLACQLGGERYDAGKGFGCFFADLHSAHRDGAPNAILTAQSSSNR